jgi:hypothetical protein
MADLVATVPGDQCDLSAIDLPFRRILAAQLPNAFHDLQHSLHMRFGKLPA